MALETKQSRRKTGRKQPSSSPSSSPWILAKPQDYLRVPKSHHDSSASPSLETQKPRRERRKKKTEPLLPVKTEPLEEPDFVSAPIPHSPPLPHSPPSLDKTEAPSTVSQTQHTLSVTEESPPRSSLRKPHISSPQSTRILTSKKAMPSDEVLNALFAKLLSRLNMSPEKVAEMNMMSSQQKWALVLAQKEVNTGLSCLYYIEQLVRHSQPSLKEKKIAKKLLDKLHPLTKVLKELEVELRTSPESWLEEFVASPNHGHIALVDLLKDLIQYPGLLNKDQKFAVLQRNPALVHTALICVRAIMSNRHGFNAVLNYTPSIYTITHCIAFPHYKTKSLVLKLLISVLLAPSGPQKVIQAFEHYRRVKGEQKIFQTLVTTILQEPIVPSYQAEVLRFINTVVQTGDGPNARIFHQQEFIRAGLDIKEIEQTFEEGDLNERLLHEIKEWKRSFLDVQQITDELMITRGRAKGLKQELDMTLTSLREARVDRDNYYDYSLKLQERCKQQEARMTSMTKDISELTDDHQERSNMIKRIHQLQEINKRYREHTSELRSKIENISGEEGLVGLEIDPSFDLQEEMVFTRSYKASTIATQTTESMTNMTEEVSTEDPLEEKTDVPNIPEPPPMPPPLPGSVPLPPPLPGIPPPPGTSTSLRKPHITNLPLPTLNWVPMRDTEHTIFDGMDDEVIIKELDLSEFETLFQVPRFKTKETKPKEPIKKKLELFDSKRTRGIIFAKRRVRKDPDTISELISNADLDGLTTEHCELLQQIVPQETERESLAKNSKDYDNFGEAEQYLYQLAKIPRLEERLGVMTFMGNFDEILIQTQPKIHAVLDASLSIFRSSRMKKVFEVVLAFGNYMNSSKRGTVTGFKLVSLQRLLDTHSTDRKQTLLHYLTHVVEKVYPNLLSFYDDLNVSDACDVSLEMIDADILNIKQGLDMLKEEQTEDPQNFVLFSFSKQVTSKVEELLDSHQKMKDAYTEVSLMFSESPKEEPSVFFGYFRTFIASWKAAIKDNHSKKSRKMAPSDQLVKKQKQDQLSSEALLKELATEAAVVASSRMNKIREETLKFHDTKTQLPPQEVDNEEKPMTLQQTTIKRKEPNSVNTGLLDDEYYSMVTEDLP